MGVRQLRLRREARIRDLLPAGSPGRLEASGVLAADGRFYVVCDNLRSVVLIDQDLDQMEANTTVPTPDGEHGYEDIARDPVTGHRYLLIEAARNWRHEATIDLPESLEFSDYSGMSMVDGRIAVVSQESSALWTGRLAPAAWAVTGPGRTYLLPRDADGRIAYCTVEGVCWLGPDGVVLVSDRAKARSQSQRCRDKDESLHIFAIPGDPA